MTSKSNFMKGILVVGAAMSLGMSATAAEMKCDYPKKAVRVLVGFSAGGGTDTYARILASVIPEYMNDQPMIIVNKPGGAQVPAMKFTAKSKKDGYTLQFFSTGSGVMATMLRDKGVEWYRDFTPISQIGNINLVITAHKDFGYKTPMDLIAAIKKSAAAGKKMRWGHPSRGSITHMAATAWMIKNNIIDMVQDVPFKGGSKARAAIVGKQVDFGAMGLQNLTGFEAKLVGLGITTSERDPVVKYVPTMKELNQPFIDMKSPMIMAAPTGTPKNVIACMDAAIKKATAHRAFKRLSKKAGVAVVYRGTAETNEMMLKLRDEWRPIVDFVKKRMAKK